MFIIFLLDKVIYIIYDIINYDLQKYLEKKIMNSKIKLFDDIKWAYEYTLKTYLKLNQKSKNDLTEQDLNEIYEYAGIHIAFFITWIVKNDYQSDLFTYDSIQKLRSEKINGIVFLKEYCDGKLASDMIKDEIISFVSTIYDDNYFKNHYAKWVMNELNDLPFEFGWNWDDYNNYEHYLNKLIKNYLNSK